VIADRATLDVPREVVWSVAKLLAAERRRRGTPRGSRALSSFWQAVSGCGDSAAAWPPRRWPVIMASPRACRYLDEVIVVLAQEAPGLRQALERARDQGFSHVIRDCTVIACDR
jgi:hypothetical protein